MVQLSSKNGPQMSPAEPAAATKIGVDSALSSPNKFNRVAELALLEGTVGVHRVQGDISYFQRETVPGYEAQRADDGAVPARNSSVSFSSVPELGDGTKPDAGRNVILGPGAIFYKANVA